MMSAAGKKIKDPEFARWKAMHEQAKRPGVWVYMNPENTEVALVWLVTGDVLFISSKDARVNLYTHPNIKQLSHQIMRIPRSVI